MHTGERQIKFRSARGFTFVENIIAMGIVVLFFSSLYAINSQCLYLLSSGRGAVFAEQALQDRMESLRSCTWYNLTNASYLQNNILNTTTTAGSNLGQPTETIMLDNYPTPTGTPIQVTRTGRTVSIVSNNQTILNSDPGLLRANIIITWTQGTGSRVRTLSTTSIISKITQ